MDYKVGNTGIQQLHYGKNMDCDVCLYLIYSYLYLFKP